MRLIEVNAAPRRPVVDDSVRLHGRMVDQPLLVRGVGGFALVVVGDHLRLVSVVIEAKRIQRGQVLGVDCGVACDDLVGGVALRERGEAGRLLSSLDERGCGVIADAKHHHVNRVGGFDLAHASEIVEVDVDVCAQLRATTIVEAQSGKLVVIHRGREKDNFVRLFSPFPSSVCVSRARNPALLWPVIDRVGAWSSRGRGRRRRCRQRWWDNAIVDDSVCANFDLLLVEHLHRNACQRIERGRRGGKWVLRVGGKQRQQREHRQQEALMPF